MERRLPLKLSTGAQKRGQMVQLEMDVPLCSECLAKENKIGNITWIPFFIVSLLVCAIVFVPVWLLAPEGGVGQNYQFPYVLGAFVGMLAGIAAASLVEFGLKMMLAPVYGKLLTKRPLTVVSVFSDSDDLIGLSAWFTEKKEKLRLTFENDETAREFIALNPQEN